MLWNGFAAPFPELLVDFSCPALPLLKPMSPSLSSSFFRRPHILNATMARPARTMAPPMPTTTPITVLFVFADMVDDEEVSFWASEAEFEGLAEDWVPVTDGEEVWLGATVICVVVVWL